MREDESGFFSFNFYDSDSESDSGEDFSSVVGEEEELVESDFGEVNRVSFDDVGGSGEDEDDSLVFGGEDSKEVFRDDYIVDTESSSGESFEEGFGESFDGGFGEEEFAFSPVVLSDSDSFEDSSLSSSDGFSVGLPRSVDDSVVKKNNLLRKRVSEDSLVKKAKLREEREVGEKREEELLRQRGVSGGSDSSVGLEKKRVRRQPSQRAQMSDVFVVDDLSGGDGFSSDSAVVKTGDEAGKGLTPGEKWKGKAKSERKKWSYERDNGLLDGAELDFFKRIDVSKRRAENNPDLVSKFREPLNYRESDEEREERVKIVSRAVGGRDAYRRNSKFSFGRKHQEILEFLALFKYANASQLSNLFSEKPYTTGKRLRGMRESGLVVDKKLYGAESVWFLTRAGMLLSGYDFPLMTNNRFTYSMVPHNFVVNHVASSLWGGSVNVLNESEFPLRNRSDNSGNPLFGDTIVSELQIQSSLSKLRFAEKSDVFVPMIKSRIKREFNLWGNKGGPSFGDSPEFAFGNEFMWAIYPPIHFRLAYHVPDLVVARPRDSDGKPNSIAVEIELGRKSEEAYERTIGSFKRAGSVFYKRVVWVVGNNVTAGRLEKVIKKLDASSFVSVVPVLTENGVFPNNNYWEI